MKHPILILLSACVASAIFIAWRVHAMRSQIVNHFELVYDPSLSFTGGCESLVGTAEKILRSPNVSENSTLTVLASGDASTGYEPRRLTTYAIPKARKVIEGRRTVVERQEHLLNELRTQCGSVRPTRVSPIYFAVKQALADLRADRCRPGSQCGLWVVTDLEENGERAIKEGINGKRSARRSLPAPLDNNGIEVTFCGFAETGGRVIGPSGHEVSRTIGRSPRRDDRLTTVWRSLFINPGIVSFDPYCAEMTERLRDHSEAKP